MAEAQIAKQNAILLVDEVGKIVHQVQNGIHDRATEEIKEVAEKIDSPTLCPNEAHGVEGHLRSHSTLEVLQQIVTGRGSQAHLLSAGLTEFSHHGSTRALNFMVATEPKASEEKTND